MKKFFLMLAVALPMFFMASCGDDNDDDVDAKIDYSMPLLTKNSAGTLNISSMKVALEWNDDMDDVMEAMNPFSYVLNTSVSTSNSLAYTYDADGAMPFYVYSFAANKLKASSITISEEQDEEIDLEGYFESNGYKDVSTDDDEDFVYRSKDKLTIVHYGYDGNVTILWTPNDGTRANPRQDLYDHLQVVNELLEQK